MKKIKQDLELEFNYRVYFVIVVFGEHLNTTQYSRNMILVLKKKYEKS